MTNKKSWGGAKMYWYGSYYPLEQKYAMIVCKVILRKSGHSYLLDDDNIYTTISDALGYCQNKYHRNLNVHAKFNIHWRIELLSILFTIYIATGRRGELGKKHKHLPEAHEALLLNKIEHVLNY